MGEGSVEQVIAKLSFEPGVLFVCILCEVRGLNDPHEDS